MAAVPVLVVEEILAIMYMHGVGAGLAEVAALAEAGNVAAYDILIGVTHGIQILAGAAASIVGGVAGAIHGGSRTTPAGGGQVGSRPGPIEPPGKGKTGSAPDGPLPKDPEKDPVEVKLRLANLPYVRDFKEFKGHARG